METQFFFLQNFEIDEIEFCPFPESPNHKKRNHLGFIDISPILIIDTSMERSSQVLQHGDPKLYIFFQKISKFTKLNFVHTPRKEITLASSISVLH